MHLDPNKINETASAEVFIIGEETGDVKATRLFGPALPEERLSPLEERITVKFDNPGEHHYIQVNSTASEVELSFTLDAHVLEPLADNSVLIVGIIMIVVYLFILIEVIHRTRSSIFGWMVALLFYFAMQGGENSEHPADYPRCEQGLSAHSTIVECIENVAAKRMHGRVTVNIPDIHIHTPIGRKRLHNLRVTFFAGQMERCHAKTVSLIDVDDLALQNLHHSPMVTMRRLRRGVFVLPWCFYCRCCFKTDGVGGVWRPDLPQAIKKPASQRRTNNKRQRQPGRCGSKKVASCENSKKTRRCNLVRCDRCRQRAAS